MISSSLIYTTGKIKNEYEIMLSLDILFENLDITVHPFLLCCAENETTLSLGPRDQATIHYVLGGTGTLRFEGHLKTLHYEPLRETERAAKELRRRFGPRLGLAAASLD